MARDTVPVRIQRETRDDLLFLARILGAEYNRDYTLSDVIDALIYGYSSGNEERTTFFRKAVNRLPTRPNPPESGETGNT
jgi:hypothetical protein